MLISSGFSEAERPAIARLYWDAFGDKLWPALGPGDRALVFLALALDPAHAIVARAASGEVLGVAGYRTPRGSLVAARFRHLRAAYGTIGALARGLVLGLIARDTDNVRFLLDGLAVAERARGQGIGSRLLEAVAAEAAARGYAEVRLDVVEGNSRARALYERRGFLAVERQSNGPMGAMLGFRAATIMVRRLG